MECAIRNAENNRGGSTRYFCEDNLVIVVVVPIDLYVNVKEP